MNEIAMQITANRNSTVKQNEMDGYKRGIIMTWCCDRKEANCDVK